MIIFIKNLGEFTLLSLENIGRFIIFGANFFFWLPRKPFFLKQFLKQVFEIGYFKNGEPSLEIYNSTEKTFSPKKIYSHF